MWRAETEPVASGHKYRLFANDDPLSFAGLLCLLDDDDGFSNWYTQLLADADFEAFYWELPPLTSTTVEHNAEFVLTNAPALATFGVDPTPFQSLFAAAPEDDVIVFPNLGGDATLIVPRPLAANEAYPHMRSFLRSAPASQVRSLWRNTAGTVVDNISETPVWLSTAGLGEIGRAHV